MKWYWMDKWNDIYIYSNVFSFYLSFCCVLLSVCIPNLCLEQRYILSTLHVKNRYTFMLTDLISMKKSTLYKKSCCVQCCGVRASEIICSIRCLTLHLELNGWLILRFKQEARIEDIDNLSLSSETGKPLTFWGVGSFVFSVWMK